MPCGAVRCGAVRCAAVERAAVEHLKRRHSQGEEEGGEREEVPGLHELALGIQQERVHVLDAPVQLVHIRLQLRGH